MTEKALWLAGKIAWMTLEVTYFLAVLVAAVFFANGTDTPVWMVVLVFGFLITARDIFKIEATRKGATKKETARCVRVLNACADGCEELIDAVDPASAEKLRALAFGQRRVARELMGEESPAIAANEYQKGSV